MTASTTNTFDLDGVDACSEAFERCGILPQDLSVYHIDSFRRSLNLWMAELGNRGPLQWGISQSTQALAASTTNYALPTGTIDVITVALRDSDSKDRLLARISRSEYLSYRDKSQTSSSGPSVYWSDRQQVTPRIYIWPAPSVTTFTLVYNYLRRLYDVTTTLTQTPDVPVVWLEALCAGVAAKLAVKWVPDRFELLKALADESFKIASDEDRERVPFKLEVDVSGYWS